MSKKSWGPAAWIGWSGAGLMALFGMAAMGVGGAVSFLGMYAMGVAVFGLLRGHVRWARLNSRGAAAGGLVAAMVAIGVGGANSTPVATSAELTAATATGIADRTSASTVPTATAVPVTASPTSAPTTSTTSSAGPTSSAPSTSPAAVAPAPATTSTAPKAAPGTALAALAALSVKGRAPKTGYDRSLFGQTWYDADRNGCDTRNDVLRRDLTGFTLKAGTRGCLVLTGTLRDPYTTTSIGFVRGQGTSSKVQIDHVVALSDAWQKGAQGLSISARTSFANDPLNLLAVDGPINLAKGDGDAATWLPPNKAYRCAYVARQVAVKSKYGLWVTAAERDAIARVLGSCPGQNVPVAGAIALGGGRVVAVTPTPKKTMTAPTTAPKPAPKPAPLVSKPTPAATTDPDMGTCKAAKAAGYGPYYAGKDPEYNWYRDADSDGIVCE